MKDYQARKKKRTRWEFLLILLLLVPLAGGIVFLMSQGGTGTQQSGSNNQSAMNAENTSLEGSHRARSGSGNGLVPKRTFPPQYKVEGTVDDRYTVAIDPSTGEMLIHDAEAGIGSNTTSVEGQRRVLVKDMLDLNKWADQNRGSSESYNWAKSTASAGMSVAYGAPGMTQSSQEQTRREKLREFQDLASNPPGKFLQSSQGLGFESAYMQQANPDGTYPPTEAATALVSGYDPMWTPTTAMAGDPRYGTTGTYTPGGTTSASYYPGLTMDPMSYSDPSLALYTPPTPTTLSPTTTATAYPAPTGTYALTAPTTLPAPTSTTNTTTSGTTATAAQLYDCTLYGNCSSTTATASTTGTSPTSTLSPTATLQPITTTTTTTLTQPVINPVIQTTQPVIPY